MSAVEPAQKPVFRHNRDAASFWNHRVALIVRACRQDAQLNQLQLSERLGWTRSMVANIESGRAQLRFSDFILVAQALELDPQILMRRVTEW